MSAFSHLPLGQRIPDSPHAVSCSLPTMRDVIGYEEKDPAVMQHLSSGYPRFVVHPFARQLADHLVATTPALAGSTLWLTSSERMAIALSAHLGESSGALRLEHGGLHGVYHPESSEIAGRAKVFLQNLGGFLSSRAAEDQLVRLGLRERIHKEETFARDPLAEVQSNLRGAIPGTSNADLFLSSSGMSAIAAAFHVVSELQAKRGRTVWLQLGWLYLDTIAILKKFTRTSDDYVYIRNVTDLPALARIFRAHGSRIAGVIAEVPTNPLIQTPDLPALAELCRTRGARLLVDPSITSVYNLEVLPHADLIVSSLTKYTASEGDLTAGLVAVNPQGPDADALRRALPAQIEPLYSRDLARLAHEIGDTRNVLRAIHTNAARVVEFLSKHPAISRVYSPLQDDSRENYLRLARSPDATGGMITFTLKEIGALERFYDRLRLPKGPSFGMKTTLICPFMYLAHYDLVTTPAGLAELAASHLDPDLLRLCVGTEPAEEIIRALDEALA